jgi:hypothetical protein
MSLSDKATLLEEAPAGRHFCQFDSDEEPLLSSVVRFAAAGLTRGELVLLAVTPAQSEALVQQLSAHRLDPARAQAAGRLRFVNPLALLEECGGGETPDVERLKAGARTLVDSLPRDGNRTVRVYGEMLGLLWQLGHAEAAIELEECWDGFVTERPLCVFCGYRVDPLAYSTYAGPFGEIGRVHSHVLATDADERLRAAVDAATEDVLGIAFSLILSCSAREQSVGEHRLPVGRRTLLWLHRNMPVTSAHILARTRFYLQQPAS